jgi:hypothetical protein
MKANQPGDLDAGELTEIVIAEIGEADIRQATPSYLSNGVQKGPPIGVEEGPPFQII